MNDDTETRHRLIVVEDEPVQLMYLSEVLSEAYKVFATDNAQDALDFATHHPTSMIISDIRMPNMSGYDLVKAVRQSPDLRTIPVILLTASDDAELKALQCGATDFVQKPVIPEVLCLRVQRLLALVSLDVLEASYRESLCMLAQVSDLNDEHTGDHIPRMAAYARCLAEHSGLYPAHLYDRLESAAMLHDIGKVGIPDAILKKHGSLTPDEWVIMKTHTTKGHTILSNSQSPVFRLGAEIALCHHERWDGTGYPNGLKGDAIPLSAQITSIADVFDALTMIRPYKHAWSMTEALDYIRDQSGRLFNPVLVDAMLAIDRQVLRDIKRQHTRP